MGRIRPGRGDYPVRVKILCLDTSAGAAVALVDDGGGAPTVVARASEEGTRRHAETLTPMVQDVLGAAPAHPDLIVVGTGPAPFTGLRVGLVTAAALGRGWGTDVVGVCSLDVLARQALDRLGAGREVLVATDARRKEVYWARYRAHGDHDVERVAGPEVATASAAAAANGLGEVDGVAADAPAGGTGDPGADTPAGDRCAVAGAGARLYPQDLPATDGLPDQLDVAVLARIARSRLARRTAGGRVELGTEPRYLRRPDVHVAGAPKRVS